MKTQPAGEKVEASERVWLKWLDSIKVIALLWIFINHTAEQVFGSPYIANPWANWVPLETRIAQLQPLTGHGVWDIPLNLWRYIGWFGDQGVQLFLIVSGFGLTWGLLARYGRSSIPLGKFYLRRAERIYPLWWGAHIGLFLTAFFFGGLYTRVIDSRFYFSLLGIRLTPSQLYYFAPAWWYVGLLIQLYLIYPILWAGLRRFGPLRLLLVSCALAFTLRAAGLLLFDDYLDAWSRGAVFITRLPEFVLGISLAIWIYDNPEKMRKQLRRRLSLLLALVAYVLGLILSLDLLGMTIAPFLLGVGAFVLLHAIFNRNHHPTNDKSNVWTRVGEHTYSLYLMHHPFILLLVPVGLSSATQTIVGPIAALCLTVAGALFLEKSVGITTSLLRRWYERAGLRGVFIRLATAGIVLAGAAIGSELLVRQVDPQEVLGWGERPALESDSRFGWRLIPSSQTRLRWASYDYLVTANSLGFPGPEYPVEKGANAFRIMTTGDAFTSAEGVDTDLAWPRLLETNLALDLSDREVQVMNFAITGYGPNQYAVVIDAFAPLYQPDLILVQVFVNDYLDVQVSDDAFRSGIGFGQPPSDSLYALVRLAHLRRFVDLNFVEPLKARVRGSAEANGYFLGNFAALEHDWDGLDTGRRMVAARLERIRAVAQAINASVVIVMAPASVQVCAPGDLLYYPMNVELNDSSQFDLDQPQRLMRELAANAGFGYYDLRPVLMAVPEGCPYQPYNMHWLPIGHRDVTAYLTETLIADGYLDT
jgi:peptidoglycan/LPS O-acetylase OafA/YrhL